MSDLEWTPAGEDWPEHESVENGRRPGEPGSLWATVGPYPHGFNVVLSAPSWLKPYWTRSWRTREQARAVAEELIALSLAQSTDLERDSIGAVITAISARVEVKV